MDDATRPVERVIFLHIPKTAGSTLRGVFIDQYPTGSVLAIGPGRHDTAMEDFKSLPLPEREKIRLLRGHFGFGLHEYLPPPVTYITILREPVARVVSHYYYVRSQLERGNAFTDRPWLREAARMSLSDYVQHGRSADVRNGQTKLMAGQMQGWGVDDEHSPGDEQLLQAAQYNLREGMAVVGLIERFDETLVLFKRRLGWRTPFYVSRNVAPNRPEREHAPPEILEAVRRENALDVQLYGDAVKLFSEAIADQGPGFGREVGRLRFLNSRRNEIRRLRRSARYRASVVLRRPHAG